MDTLLKFQHIEPVGNRDDQGFMLFFPSHFSYLEQQMGVGSQEHPDMIGKTIEKCAK